MWRYPRELLLSIITLSTCHACITNEKTKNTFFEKVTKSDWGNKTYKLKVYFCRGHSLQYLQTAHNYYISPYNMAGESARKKKRRSECCVLIGYPSGQAMNLSFKWRRISAYKHSKNSKHTTQQNCLLPSVFDHVFIRFRRYIAITPCYPAKWLLLSKSRRNIRFQAANV